MHRTFAWWLTACLIGSAAVGQEPGRPSARARDPRTQADAERLPANRIPDQPGVHSLIGPADARQLLGRTADQGGWDVKHVSTRMPTGADAKAFGPLAEFSNHSLSQVQGLRREALGREAAAPDPSLKPNHMDLPAQASSFHSGPGPGRTAPAATLK